MNTGITRVIGVMIGAALIAGAAYWVGLNQGATRSGGQAASTQAGAEAAAPGPLAPGAALPEAHRPIPARPARIKAPGRERIEYTHFRVGNRNVKAILSDHGVVWVGTSGGVVRYTLASDEHRLFDVRSGLLSNGIFHLSKLGDRLVVGTYGGGLSLLDPETESWENFNVQHGLGDAFIYDFLKLRNGDIWIATWSGANRILGGDLNDSSKWELYTVENTGGGLPNDWVYGLTEGKNGEVWMATEGGLARFVDGKWDNWKHADGLGAPYEVVRNQIEFTRDPAKESSHHARQKREMGLENVDVAYNPNYIVALYVDEEGTVWCGTWGGGLARFDGQTWKNFTVRDGLPSNHVFMLGREELGRIWVGTGDGLARFNGKNFTVFNVNDGLFAKNIFSMDYSEDGSLWLGSYGGVSKMMGMRTVP